jgi:hypothetical protein
MNYKPCRVTFEGTRYEVSKDGTVRETSVVAATRVYGPPVDSELASRVRKDAARQRRNKSARETSEVYRSLGMKKTPYGWE